MPSIMAGYTGDKISRWQGIRLKDVKKSANQDTAQHVLQLSRLLYKSALFIQNKANFRNAKNGRNILFHKGL